jgi:hypothetical protein
MANAARPILVSEFDEYMSYGLAVNPSMDAASLVNCIFVPLTNEVAA